MKVSNLLAAAGAILTLSAGAALAEGCECCKDMAADAAMSCCDDMKAEPAPSEPAPPTPAPAPSDAPAPQGHADHN